MMRVKDILKIHKPRSGRDVFYDYVQINVKIKNKFYNFRLAYEDNQCPQVFLKDEILNLEVKSTRTIKYATDDYEEIVFSIYTKGY